jgi:fructokinase
VSETVDVGIEFGGTKVVVASSGDGRTLDTRVWIPTTEPHETLRAVRAEVSRIREGHPVAAIGIGSFGPIDLREGSDGFGTILRSPKVAWNGVQVGQSFSDDPVPWSIDTDVNAALRAERTFGSAIGETGAYLTVGTGIGGGIWVGDGPVHAANHPEIGHLRVERYRGDDFGGVCPYHGDCLEGLASGPAIETRFGAPAESLRGDEAIVARDLIAFYIAGGIVGLCSVVPVECVIIGGGVAHMAGFHEAVRAAVPGVSAGYPPVPFDGEGPRIEAPALGDDAGVIGAILLAMRARSVSGGTPRSKAPR